MIVARTFFCSVMLERVVLNFRGGFLYLGLHDFCFYLHFSTHRVYFSLAVTSLKQSIYSHSHL